MGTLQQQMDVVETEIGCDHLRRIRREENRDFLRRGEGQEEESEK